jgi:serine/threonine protein kinase
MGDVIQIHSFDGQIVWKEAGRELFEIGNFLGGGASGTVYECEHVLTKCRYALKILNPLGFKLSSPSLLKKYSILRRGETYNDSSVAIMGHDHIWWLYNPVMKQYHACFFSSKDNCIKELSLLQCMGLWGKYFDFRTTEVCKGSNNYPSVPPKYVEFVAKRDKIFREILNMRKISSHKNVIRLEGVLELVQESKYTVFLVMELANGGELFDRIKIDQGTKEETALIYFKQLAEGVYHCHRKGVCHRDLKPEVSGYVNLPPCVFIKFHC